MNYYLAIDIGASSGRHILGWLQDGKLQTQEIYRFKNSPLKVRLQSDGKEHYVWDTNDLYTSILQGLKMAKEVGKIPTAISIDTWGVDYALLDENDKLIECMFAYRDSRTDEVIDKLHNQISFEELYSKTGIAFNLFNSFYQLYHDSLTKKMQKAKSMLFVPDYFQFLLTGKKVQEYTFATTSGLVNGKTRDWDKEIIQKLGFKQELFLPLTKSGSVVGELTKEVQDFVGYNAKVIACASHDTASAVLAAPIQKGAPYISSGTWSLLGVEQDFAHTDKKVMQTGYSNEGSINGVFRLQKNIMGLWMIQRVRAELNDKYTFAQLAEMAKSCPIDALIDVNDNRFLSPESMISEINNAVGKQLSVGEMAYVIFNNLAIDYAKSLTALEEVTGEKYQTLNIIGGGSQNVLLNELTKIKTERKIIIGPTECTAIGNLLMQMVGLGDITDLQTGREIVKNSFDIKEV